MPALYRPIATKQQETSKHTNTHIHTAWLSPVHCYRVKYERFKAWFSIWNTFTFLSVLWSEDQLKVSGLESIRDQCLKVSRQRSSLETKTKTWFSGNVITNMHMHLLAWLHTVYQLDRVYTDVSPISPLLCLL